MSIEGGAVGHTPGPWLGKPAIKYRASSFSKTVSMPPTICLVRSFPKTNAI